MSNWMPERYRQVAVAEVHIPLEESHLVEFFLGREVYRRTAYVIAIRGDQQALLAVEKKSEEPLFSPVESVELLAGPSQCALVRDPAIDVGVPSQMAEVATRHPDVRCVIVEGRYRHISFILDARPLTIRVRDVVPPRPAKLLDQAQRVIDTADDLPPIRLVEDLVDIGDLIEGVDHVLLPCRGAGEEQPGTTISYLDQRPSRGDWLLIGCERSRQIHDWFYGTDPPSRDICPRNRPEPEGFLLTKCCLIEEGMEVAGQSVTVPWGSDLATVRRALEAIAARMAAPAPEPDPP